MKNKKFLLTNYCAWEGNKKNKTSHQHAVQVVDMETGEVRFIRSGSIISFVDGFITETQTQEEYNKLK